MTYVDISVRSVKEEVIFAGYHAAYVPCRQNDVAIYCVPLSKHQVGLIGSFFEVA